MNIKKYEKLRAQLSENKKWPLRYMFKFIVPNTNGKVDQVLSLLPKEGKTTFKHTKSLTYIAVTCIANMNSANDIVIITHKASEIEGVLPL